MPAPEGALNFGQVCAALCFFLFNAHASECVLTINQRCLRLNSACSLVFAQPQLERQMPPEQPEQQPVRRALVL